MNEPVERALQALKSASLDRGLDQLEPAVWARIEARREAREALPVFLPVRAAAVVAALAFGVAIGGVSVGEARAQRQEVSVFSMDSGLAPSTLLEGRR